MSASAYERAKWKEELQECRRSLENSILRFLTSRHPVHPPTRTDIVDSVTVPKKLLRHPSIVPNRDRPERIIEATLKRLHRTGFILSIGRIWYITPRGENRLIGLRK